MLLLKRSKLLICFIPPIICSLVRQSQFFWWFKTEKPISLYSCNLSYVSLDIIVLTTLYYWFPKNQYTLIRITFLLQKNIFRHIKQKSRICQFAFFDKFSLMLNSHILILFFLIIYSSLFCISYSLYKIISSISIRPLIL